MEITVTMLDGGSHDLTVNPQDTVSSLKTLIQNELGVPVQEQRLVFVGAQMTPLNNDSNPLNQYGLHPGSQVSLLVTQPPPVQVTQLPSVQVAQWPPFQFAQPRPIQVFLKNDKGKLSTYDISPDMTLDHFMAKVEQREGVPRSQQRLLHQGRQLTTGRLLDYNITDHSTIDLMLRLRGGDLEKSFPDL